MWESTICPDPECQAPAEVLGRFDLPSADGLIAFVRIQCARRHSYTVPEQPRRSTAQYPLPAVLRSIVSGPGTASGSRA